MNKTYWIYIEPYVSISIIKKQVLLYNTVNGKAIEYSDKKDITKLVRKLNLNKNLLVSKLSESDLQNQDIQNFVKKLRKYYIGDLVVADQTKRKPIQIKPIFNIHKNFKILKESKEISIGTKVMQNVSEITVYINNTCSLTCPSCRTAFKQFSYCTKSSRKGHMLDITTLKPLFAEMESASIRRLIITGGNIFSYPDFDKLMSLIRNFGFNPELNVHYQNIDQFALQTIGECRLNVLIDFPLDDVKFAFVIEMLRKHRISTHYVLNISSIQELNGLEQIFRTLNINDYSVYPFYNGKNFSFFKKNVFLNKQDIFNANPTITDLYSRTVINSANFGKLTVMSDGNIYGNINEKPIGTFPSTNLRIAANSEMEKGRSWQKLRMNHTPCKKCLYKQLCPPISNYEYALNRLNLCNIKL